MGSRAGGRRTGPKCIAIVGPFASGKTTLLEAILARTGAIPRQNPVSSGNTVSDHSAEARAHAMSVEASVATIDFMGESLTFVDCPGSVEFAFEADAVLAACDIAVVVAEADAKKIPALQLIMRKLDDLGVPRILFLNKIDKTAAGVRDTLKMLQPASSAPLLLAPDPAAQGRHRHRLDRSGAGARLYLARLRRERDRRDSRATRRRARSRRASRCSKRWPTMTTS